MSKFKKIGKVASILGLTTATGYAASRVSSTPAEAGRNSLTGAGVGFAAGALRFAAPKIIKSPAVRDTAKYFFRRIRGRIVPIRKK